MHNAGTSHPIGHGYVQALNSWLLDNRLSLSPADRAKLFTVMEILPAIEAWRLTLPEAQRLRLNHPATVLRNYRKSTGIGPAPETSLHRQRRHHHSLRTMVPRDALSLTP